MLGPRRRLLMTEKKLMWQMRRQLWFPVAKMEDRLKESERSTPGQNSSLCTSLSMTMLGVLIARVFETVSFILVEDLGR